MNIKKILVAQLCMVVALPALFAAGKPLELKNAGFEQVDKRGYPVGWSRHANWHGEKAGHNGSGGFVFECSEAKPVKGGRPQQEIKIEAGKRYYISALVRAEKLKTERKTHAQGLSFYLEGFNAEGKWAFDAASRTCVNGTTDWVKLEAITREVPDGIVRAYIQPWAKKCVSGRGVIDNIYIAEYDMPPVEGVFCDAYRRESTGGQVKFSASLNTDTRRNKLEDYAAAFSYVAADGSRQTVPGTILSPSEGSVTLDTSRFAIGTNDVICTLSLGGKALGSASMPFVRLATPTPRKVYIDRYRRTIVDGKPFFPLGMYFRNRDCTESNLAVYAEGPFNCVMPYAGSSLGKRELDIYHAAGMKVIFDLRHGISDEKVGKPWVYETVPKYKDHPALLAWYTNDERPVSDIPKLMARQGWVEELDKDHPTWSVQDVFSEARHYLGTYDVLGMDPYPIPKKPIERVILSMRQGVSGTFGSVAIWQVPQAFGWGWLKRRETKGQRAPTQKEMANMTWQSIAGGANGIIYYAYMHLYERHDDPNDAFAPAWARTKAAASEIKKYEPVLLTIPSGVTVSGTTEAVAARVWRHEGNLYLLAVNCTMQPQTVALSLSERFGSVVSADFGPAPKVEDGRLALSFGPIDYVMLRLSPTGK